jgi:integrase
MAVGFAGYLMLCTGDDQLDPSLPGIARLIERVRAESFPQLKGAEIELHSLSSDYVYLEARFTLPSFFAPLLRYELLFNPAALARHIPDDALQAIVAHKLSHIDYYQSHSRMGLLALVQILSAKYNARFERTADLESIRLGYGPGLASFRAWLYLNVPADRMEEKKRDYFSPSEIEAILAAMHSNPEIMRTFSKCVPRDLAAIAWEVNNPAAACPD